MPAQKDLRGAVTYGSNAGMGRSAQARAPRAGELYAAYSRRVLRWALRFFPRVEAEEVVHEVFLKVVERIDDFRQEASATTWLYRLTVNHCINRKRNARRRQELWTEYSPGWSPAAVSPEDLQTVVWLRRRWRALDPELVEIAVYAHVDGMTHAEIAGLLRCSPRTVGNRLQQLRDAVEMPRALRLPRRAWHHG